MKPVEFVTWMAGAMEIFGEETPPSKEAWQKMYTKMGEAMGYLVARKIFESAERRDNEMTDAERQLEAMRLAQHQYQQQMKYQMYHSGTAISGTGVGTVTYTNTAKL